MRVLHLAPHPDDEILGAGATLLMLAGAGHEVTTLAVSLGRRAEHETRRAEVEAACGRLGVKLDLLDPPLAMSRGEGDDLLAAEARLTDELRERIPAVDLLVGPALDDAHPGHALVARAGLSAVDGSDCARVWLWSLWSSLTHPTAVNPVDEPTMERLEQALQEHRSQIARNDYPKLLRGRAMAAAVLGPELILGTGHKGIKAPYAELISELVAEQGGWRFGPARVLGPEL